MHWLRCKSVYLATLSGHSVDAHAAGSHGLALLNTESLTAVVSSCRTVSRRQLLFNLRRATSAGRTLAAYRAPPVNGDGRVAASAAAGLLDRLQVLE